MSWHYLQGQEAASWAESCLVGAPSALLRLIPFVATSCSNVKPMECCNDSQFGTMCKRSSVARGAGTSTSSAADFHAKTLAQLASELGSMAQAAAFGASLRESLARCGLDLHSSKTPRVCAVTDWRVFSKTWPAWGMTRGGVCWELATSAPRISEIASGYLPTPTTIGNELAPSMAKWPTHARLQQMLPTLRASDGPNRNSTGKRSPRLTLPIIMAYAADRKGPSLEGHTGGPWITFREWMMGWPIGWTALEPLAMAKFRAWRRSHSKFSARG